MTEGLELQQQRALVLYTSLNNLLLQLSSKAAHATSYKSFGS